MSLLIPRYPTEADVPFDRITRALLDNDQFDDWLPDPIYYEDQRYDLGSTIRRVKSLWDGGALPTPDIHALALPRAHGRAVPSLALPFDARLCAHAVITALAPRVTRALPRDKVYGFRFLRDGTRVFDPPGQELGQLFDIVASAARATQEGTFSVLDVVAFNATARPDRLATILQACGARADECYFIRQLAGLGGGGLPSIDDAFAFAYNFYLQPVDVALMKRQHNFFRYRDEYFVFDEAAKKTISTGVGALDMQVRPTARSDIDEAVDEMKGRISPSTRTVEHALVTLPQGVLTASIECRGFIGEDCTDYSEVEFQVASPPFEALFKQRLSTGAIDAVGILPHLRYANRERRAGVLLAPPFAGETEELKTFRARLRNGREWLDEALATAGRSAAAWLACWTAALLSDLGPLTERETGLLLAVIASASMAEPAKLQARLALARSSSLGAERFWTKATPSSPYGLRAMLVAGRHLARRNPAPWNSIRQAVGAREPQLVRHLEANIVVKP